MTMPEASRGERQPMDVAALLASLTGLSSSAAACRYAEAGIPVFPCITGGKRPLTKRGFHEASTEPRQVARWWARWPRANIGMPTGQISGLEVVDVDVHGAIRGFAAFELARREGLTDRWAAFIRTPSGGVHAYYPADPELVQPSWQVARAGIDFRGWGLTPDLGHADSSTMLGKRESEGWQGRTTRTSSGSVRWICTSPRRARR